MRRVVVLVMIVMLVILVGCGKKQMEAKPLSTPTANVVGTTEPAPEPEPTPEQTTAPAEDESSGQTAAEAIVGLQTELVQTAAEGRIEGNLYPPAPEGVEGFEALKARTKALMSQSGTTDLDVEADRDFGSRFSDGLPDGYGDDGSAGE